MFGFKESEFWVAPSPWLQFTSLTLPAPSAHVFLLKPLFPSRLITTVPADEVLKTEHHIMLIIMIIIVIIIIIAIKSGFCVYIPIKCLYGCHMSLEGNLPTLMYLKIPDQWGF